MASGTSFSAAYVSGVAALLLERDPALRPADVRATLMRTARDLGAPGRDDLFGAGEADAFAAVSAVAASPSIAATEPARSEKVVGRQNAGAPSAEDAPASAVALDKPVSGEATRPSAQ